MKEDRKHVEERVIAFVQEQTGWDAGRLTNGTRLRADLGLDGDDAGEFFKDFAEEFSVDLRQFDYGRVFGPEGCNPFAFTLWIVYWFRPPPDPSDVTISDLVLAVLNKCWIAPSTSKQR